MAATGLQGWGWVLEVIVHCDTPAILQCLHRLILEKQAVSRWPPQGWVLEVIVILTQCVMCCGMWETVFPALVVIRIVGASAAVGDKSAVGDKPAVRNRQRSIGRFCLGHA